jgi:hypothetical protein
MRVGWLNGLELFEQWPIGVNGNEKFINLLPGCEANMAVSLMTPVQLFSLGFFSKTMMM